MKIFVGFPLFLSLVVRAFSLYDCVNKYLTRKGLKNEKEL